MRPWTAGDAPLMRAALDASESHLRAWTPWVVDGRVPGLSLEERLARHATAFANGDEWVYGIFSPDGREVLGGCGLYARVGPGAVEIGYWLGATHTGRGLATAAARALALIAFESPDVERVEIRCDPANVASARVPERLGFSANPSERSPEGLMIWRMGRADRARLAV
jgi:RimJ/RimL family protein N-acetyltransferase